MVLDCRGVQILARLDRIYSFQPVGAQASPVAKYYIKADSNHSDHLPVWGKFTLQAAPPQTLSYKMNVRYFDNIEVKVKFHQIWMDNPSLSFFGKLRRIVKFYKGHCIAAAKAHREEEAHLRLQLAEAVEALQANPSNPNCQAHLSDIEDRLGRIEHQHVEGLKVRN